jgi:hypothetical protein
MYTSLIPCWFCAVPRLAVPNVPASSPSFSSSPVRRSVRESIVPAVPPVPGRRLLRLPFNLYAALWKYDGEFCSGKSGDVGRENERQAVGELVDAAGRCRTAVGETEGETARLWNKP